MNDIAYLNGEFIKRDQAKVSIEDRGFQFGDSIYEVIKLYDGQLFALERHLHRMLKGINRIDINFNYNLEELKKICKQVIKKNQDYPKSKSGSLYIQVTRGSAPRSHGFTSDLEPTIIMYLLPTKEYSQELRKEGAAAITMPDRRWELCSVKSTNLLPNILSKQEAKEKGVIEALFVADNKKITEGSSSNVFIVNEGVVKTSPATDDILNGITRSIILDLDYYDFVVREEKFSLNDLYDADEVFITSTTKEVLGIVEIDDKKINNGRVGPITQKIHQKFKNYLNEYLD